MQLKLEVMSSILQQNANLCSFINTHNNNKLNRRTKIVCWCVVDVICESICISIRFDEINNNYHVNEFNFGRCCVGWMHCTSGDNWRSIYWWPILLFSIVFFFFLKCKKLAYGNLIDSSPFVRSWRFRSISSNNVIFF